MLASTRKVLTTRAGTGGAEPRPYNAIRGMSAGMGDAFKALADPTRRRILELLAQGDLTAGEIAAHFEMTKPSVSHHLNILKSAELITDERRGQNIVYSVNLTVFQELMKWFYDCGLVGGHNDEKE